MHPHGHDDMLTTAPGMRTKSHGSVSEKASEIIALAAQPSDGVVENRRVRAVVLRSKHEPCIAPVHHLDELGQAAQHRCGLFSGHRVDRKVIGVEGNVLDGMAHLYSITFHLTGQGSVVSIRGVNEHEVRHGLPMAASALSLAVSHH